MDVRNQNQDLASCMMVVRKQPQRGAVVEIVGSRPRVGYQRDVSVAIHSKTQEKSGLNSRSSNNDVWAHAW